MIFFFQEPTEKKSDKKENKSSDKKTDKKPRTKKTTDEKQKKKENSKSKTDTPKKEKKSDIEKPKENIDTNIETCRKWNDYKNKEPKKGPFTPEEMNKIKDAICFYAFENNLNENDIINLVTEKQSKKDRSIWPKIAECLPDRSVQSIHNFCHRSFNPYNYKGNWSDEEVVKMIR